MMNDETVILENQTDDASTPNDFVETAPATPTDSPTTEEEETPLGEPMEIALGVPTDPGTDSDPDCEDSDPTPQKSELDELRSELMQLRQALDESHARLAQMAHIERQYTEFCTLYPNTPISTVSKEVWQGVEDGNSLAASFALAEHRKALSLKMAADSNADNRTRSAGAAGQAESVEFSPAEVRAMSSQEVRANLSKIMRSMQKWH
jgi:hypothetical protein